MYRSKRKRMHNPRTNFRMVPKEERERRRKNAEMDRARYKAAYEEAKARICPTCKSKSKRACSKCQKPKMYASLFCPIIDKLEPRRSL